MTDSRSLLWAALAGLAATLALGLAGILRPEWGPAHVDVALFGFLLPGLAFLHWHVAGPRMPRPCRTLASSQPSGSLARAFWLLRA